MGTISFVEALSLHFMHLLRTVLDNMMEGYRDLLVAENSDIPDSYSKNLSGFSALFTDGWFV